MSQKNITQAFGEYLDCRIKAISFLLQNNPENSLEVLKQQFHDLVNMIYDTFLHIKLIFYSADSKNPSLIHHLLLPIIKQFPHLYSESLLQSLSLDWIQSVCNSWLTQSIQAIEMLGSTALRIASKAQRLKEVEQIVLESIIQLENPKPDGEKWSQV